ncbi:MAG TPA: hypothetical protein VF043_10100 [Ktedonobacteraceae bacterium]
MKETARRIRWPCDEAPVSSHAWAWSTRDGTLTKSEIDYFVHGLIAGKDAMVACHLAQRHIDRRE